MDNSSSNTSRSTEAHQQQKCSTILSLSSGVLESKENERIQMKQKNKSSRKWRLAVCASLVGGCLILSFCIYTVVFSLSRARELPNVEVGGADSATALHFSSLNIDPVAGALSQTVVERKQEEVLPDGHSVIVDTKKELMFDKDKLIEKETIVQEIIEDGGVISADQIENSQLSRDKFDEGPENEDNNILNQEMTEENLEIQPTSADLSVEESTDIVDQSLNKDVSEPADVLNSDASDSKVRPLNLASLIGKVLLPMVTSRLDQMLSSQRTSLKMQPARNGRMPKTSETLDVMPARRVNMQLSARGGLYPPVTFQSADNVEETPSEHSPEGEHKFKYEQTESNMVDYFSNEDTLTNDHESVSQKQVSAPSDELPAHFNQHLFNPFANIRHSFMWSSPFITRPGSLRSARRYLSREFDRNQQLDNRKLFLPATIFVAPTFSRRNMDGFPPQFSPLTSFNMLRMRSQPFNHRGSFRETPEHHRSRTPLSGGAFFHGGSGNIFSSMAAAFKNPSRQQQQQQNLLQQTQEIQQPNELDAESEPEVQEFSPQHSENQNSVEKEEAVGDIHMEDLIR